MSTSHESKLTSYDSLLALGLLDYHVRNFRASLLDLLSDVDTLLAQFEEAAQLKLAQANQTINLYHEVQRYEKELIKWALKLTGGHQSRAANILGVNVTTLNMKIMRYDLSNSIPGLPAKGQQRRK